MVVLDTLLLRLHERPSSALVSNQYEDANLLNNLRLYLEYLLRHPSDVIMVGEAPGYQGCRLTGIPFTSGEVIRKRKHQLFRDIGPDLKLSMVAKEPTASLLWGTLENAKRFPLLWNAFPFHPHHANKPDSNRKPTAEEVREGKSYLELICAIFTPQRFYSIGRVGQHALKCAFGHREVVYIRHPSYGGKNDFLGGIRAALF